MAKYTCKNCKLYRNGECFGSRNSKTCSSFKYVPSVTEHDRIYSPAVMRSSRFAGKANKKKNEQRISDFKHKNDQVIRKNNYSKKNKKHVKKRKTQEFVIYNYIYVNNYFDIRNDDFYNQHYNEYTVVLYCNKKLVENKLIGNYLSLLKYKQYTKEIINNPEIYVHEDELFWRSLNKIIDKIKYKNKRLSVITNYLSENYGYEEIRAESRKYRESFYRKIKEKNITVSYYCSSCDYLSLHNYFHRK